VATVCEAVSPALIPLSKDQQFPLRSGKPASRGNATEPVRYISVVGSGIPEPLIVVGSNFSQCRRLFV
jgi:hypothetical protein